MAIKQGSKLQTIYIADKDKFNSLKIEVQSLWYKTYNEYISLADVFIKSLYITKKVLEKEVEIKNDANITDKYGRIN